MIVRLGLILKFLDNFDIFFFQIQQVSDENFLFDVWSKLAKGAQEGSRVIILLLESSHQLLFLQTASTLYEEGLIQPGDFVYIMTKSPRAFIKKEWVLSSVFL